MKQLKKRQLNILEFIRNNKGVSNKEIRVFISDISRITIVRNLKILLNQRLIKKEGGGRSIRYFENIQNNLLRYFDVGKYFKTAVDERNISFEKFNFDIFNHFENIFSEEETKKLREINNDYERRIKQLPETILKRETERLSIELSWKSSQIEGNTYSLLDTEVLIKENKEAEGHKKEEAVMILNHKKALDYIFDKRSDFKNISLGKIENIHKLIVGDLNVKKGLREKPVGITGTRYKPLDNSHQIREAIEKMIESINKLNDSFSKAMLVILMVSYIQPFEDGNKRTGRILGNAILLANNICPLSLRSISESDYRKATVLFYEQNSLRFFKELFVQQFEFAVKNYFLG